MLRNAWCRFVREKPIGPDRYLYLVESVREDGRIKQRIIKNLGRKEEMSRRTAISIAWPAPPPGSPGAR